MNRATRIAAGEAHLAESAVKLAAFHPLAALSRPARLAVEAAILEGRWTLYADQPHGPELVAAGLASRHQDGDYVTYRINQGVPMLVAAWKSVDALRRYADVSLRHNIAQQRIAEALGIPDRSASDA